MEAHEWNAGRDLDLTDEVQVLDRARYLDALFGYEDFQYRFSSRDLASLRDQVRDRRLSEGFLVKIVAEVPPEVVERRASPRAPEKTDGCRGRGYYRSGDTDYDCSGCAGCRHQDARVGWSVSAFVWSVATGAERGRLERATRGFRALAQVGAAVAAALSPGRSVARFMAGAVVAWARVAHGRWYRVEGRRGSAKAHHGAVGVVAWTGTSSLGVARVGLRVPAGSAGALPGPTGSRGALVYVPASCLVPVVPSGDLRDAWAAEQDQRASARAATEAAREAQRQARPACTGRRGDPACVVSGPSTGAAGALCWVGAGRDGTPRVGVKSPSGEVAWCSAHDVVAGESATHLALALETRRDAASLTAAEGEILATVEGALRAGQAADPADRAVLADSLEERGFGALAARWRGQRPKSRPSKAKPRARPAKRAEVSCG